MGPRHTQSPKDGSQADWLAGRISESAFVALAWRQGLRLTGLRYRSPQAVTVGH